MKYSQEKYIYEIEGLTCCNYDHGCGQRQSIQTRGDQDQKTVVIEERNILSKESCG